MQIVSGGWGGAVRVYYSFFSVLLGPYISCLTTSGKFEDLTRDQDPLQNISAEINPYNLKLSSLR